MPSSTHYLINDMVSEILKTNPKSILDLGVGYGKYGFLCREFLETHEDRVYPEQWNIKIDGIEIWKEYVKRFSWLKTFYNNIYVGDAHKLIDKVGNYDLIIAGDIIEHLPRKEAYELLIKCIRKANKCVLVSIPTGNWLHNRIWAKNPYEEHKSIWWAKELIKIGHKELGYSIKTYFRKGIKGNDCVAVFRKENLKTLLYIGYYTKNTKYEKEAEKLISSLDKFELPHKIKGIDDLGDWNKNTHYKATFIRKMLDKYPNKNLVFLDVDIIIKQYPKLFYDIRADFAVHYIDWNIYKRIGKFKELNTSVMYFANNKIVKKFLDAWIEKNRTENIKIWEQKKLQALLDEGWKNKLKIHLLPATYCKIFDLMHIVKEPVIELYQASRRLKK